MSELKARIHVVVLENEKLHNDLKAVAIERLLQEQTKSDVSVSLF